MNKTVANNIIKEINGKIDDLKGEIAETIDDKEKEFIKGQMSAYRDTKTIMQRYIMTRTEKVNYLYEIINVNLDYKMSMKNLKSFIADIENENNKVLNVLDILLETNMYDLLDIIQEYGY